MAVISSVPGISVTVHNEEGELPEYADTEPSIVEGLQSPPSVVVSNYIEVPPNGGPFWLEFSVQSSCMHPPHGVLFGFEVPSGDIRNWMIYTSKWFGNILLRGESEGYAGGDELNPVFTSFKFDKLKKLSGDGESDGLSPTERKRMESIGMFQIRIILGKPDEVGALQQTQGPKQANHTSPAMAAITEKIAARKSIANTDKILDPLAIPVVPTSRYTYNNAWNFPIAIFQFKYRSKADLQRLLCIQTPPVPKQLPRQGVVSLPVSALVPTSTQEPQKGQGTQEQAQSSQSAQPVSKDLSKAITRPQFKAQIRAHVGNGEMQLQVTPNSAESSSLSQLGANSRAFEKLKFTEVRDLARKKYKCFDDLNGDEIEKLARQKHSEEMLDASGGPLSHTTGPFEDLTFEEVWDLAKQQYKGFNELNGREIQDLARQRYNEAMASAPKTPPPIENQDKTITELATSQPVADKKALNVNNEKGKRSAPIELTDGHEDSDDSPIRKRPRRPRSDTDTTCKPADKQK